MVFWASIAAVWLSLIQASPRTWEENRREGGHLSPQTDGRAWSDAHDIYGPFACGFLLLLSLTHIFSLADSRELPHCKENVPLIIS